MTGQKVQLGMPLCSINFKSAIEPARQGPTIFCLSDHPVRESDDDHGGVFHIVRMQESACFRVESNWETLASESVEEGQTVDSHIDDTSASA